jgi:hypothetical protein
VQEVAPKQGHAPPFRHQNNSMSAAFPLPPDLPKPVNDGACDHLAGMRVPSITLPSTSGRMVNLGALTAPRTVIYCYPRTGVPGEPLPEGWDMIPGARGCTPQACDSGITTGTWPI